MGAKFALALGRSTSRKEDRAYSLLGLFGVNMSLLYGEGDRAFKRLQREIIQQYNDHSIFLHTGIDLVADRLKDFTIHRYEHKLEETLVRPEPYSGETAYGGVRTLTSRGVEMQARYLEIKGYDHIRLLAIGYSLDRSLAPLSATFMPIVKENSFKWRKADHTKYESNWEEHLLGRIEDIERRYREADGHESSRNVHNIWLRDDVIYIR